MLYDPKWEVETKAPTKPDPYTLPTLIAWLELQPADLEYDFMDCGGLCLLSQYMAVHGIDLMKWDRKHRSSAYSAFCDATGFDDIAVEHPRTFGAALDRARALL